ncbi:glycosyltransferase family 4 protein, partial [bacterium]|nr:glycosyltransferase family 4 protein [bacterium]
IYKTMRILIIVNEFPPDIVAGTAMSTFYLSKYLSQRGNEVHVAITMRGKNRPIMEKMDGVNIHRFSPIKIKGTKSIQRLFRLYQLACSIDPDIMQGQAISCGMFAALIGRVLKKPSITYIQGYDLYHASALQKLTEVRIALKYSKAILAVSEDLKEKAVNIFQRPDIVVMPHGLENEKGIEIDLNNIRQESGFLSQNRIILYVGQLNERKGLPYLIKAMKIVHQKIKNARLVIIGQGSEEKPLRELVGQKRLREVVQFLGVREHRAVLAYMSLADIFVLPSLEEPFGIVLVEAMSQGLPIVATRVQGIPSIVKNGINGFLVPSGNGRLLAEKIIFLIEHSNVAREMGERNKKDSFRFHWNHLVDRYTEIYSRLQKAQI